jgi:hypothetical protein
MAVALSGCVRIVTNLKINPDETVAASAIVVYEDEAMASMVEQTGMDETTILDQLGVNELLDGASSPMMMDGEIEEYAANGYTGWRVANRDDVPLDQLAVFGAENVTIEVTDNRYSFDAVIDLSPEALGIGGYEDTPQVAEMMTQVSVELTVEFPVKVKSATGAITGRSVTFTPVFGEVTHLEAVAEGGFVLAGTVLVLLICLAVVLVGIGLVIALLMMRRRRHARLAEAAAEGSSREKSSYRPLPAAWQARSSAVGSVHPAPRPPSASPDADVPGPDEPGSDEPALDEATPDEPAPDEPVLDEPADKPASDEPSSDEPAPDEATPDEATPDEPVPDQATP